MKAVALVALCGCNQVFGLQATGLVDVDGSVTTIITDAPRELRIDSVTPPRGSVMPAQGDVALDGNGVGQIVATYRARHARVGHDTVKVQRRSTHERRPSRFPPGDYDVIAVFSQNVTIPYVTNGLFGVQNFTFSMAMGNPWSGSSGNWIAVANKTHCMFMRAGQ